MKDPYGLSKASIPSAYAQLLLEILSERNIDPTLVLRSSTLPAGLLTQPDARLTPRQWSRLVLAALRLGGDDGLGYEYGLRLRPTAHGVLGYALMSAPTVGQALDLVVAFLSMRLRDYRMEVRQEGEQALIEVAETHPVLGGTPEEARALRRFFHECLMLGVVHGARFLTGRDDISTLTLRVDWPEPTYHARYRDRLPQVDFDQPRNQIVFPAAELQTPLATADAAAYRQALAFCEQERARFGLEIEDLVQQVRAALVLTPGAGFPNLEAVAAQLHLSGRTLKRRLQALGKTYLELLEEARRQEAERLLAGSDMEVQDIAGLLGYTGPANFTRAFRKWTSETPSQFRARIKSA